MTVAADVLFMVVGFALGVVAGRWMRKKDIDAAAADIARRYGAPPRRAGED